MALVFVHFPKRSRANIITRSLVSFARVPLKTLKMEGRYVSTADMADEAVNDLTALYMGSSHRGKKASKGKTTVRLHPLDTPSPLISSQSSSSLVRNADAGFPLAKAKARMDDFHYASHLAHRAANISRLPQPKASPSKNIGQQIEAVQLQVLQESDVLTKVTELVSAQYTALEDVAQTILSHRKELSAKVSEINQNYVDLFETMLTEVMRIQRGKFKVSRPSSRCSSLCLF